MYDSGCLFHDNHVDTEFSDNGFQKKWLLLSMFLSVVHSANYGQKYFIQVIPNIIGYFT